MHLLLFGVFLLLVTIGVSQIENSNYRNVRVYKDTIKNKTIQEEFKKIADSMKLVYLSDPGTTGNFEVAVAPSKVADFEEAMKSIGVSLQLLVQDLQELIEREKVVNNVTLEWTKYHSLYDINRWVNDLPEQYPEWIEKFDIGLSYENRTIYAIKISYKKGNKAIFMESSIHAIEWISSAAGTCFINKLLNSKKNRKMRNLLKNYDWIYIPVVNPDGLEYSHNVSRIWRKNRRPIPNSNCYGVDLNRNFNSSWGEDNYSNPCNYFYAGVEPDSEPEIRALQNFFDTFPKGYIRMYLALHSFGNMLLLPYGFTSEILPPNYKQMEAISKGFVDSVKRKHSTVFRYGASGKLLYVVAGASKDWAYTERNVSYTATIELRAGSEQGFILPSEEIMPVCDELTDGLVGMIKAAKKQKLFAEKKVY